MLLQDSAEPTASLTPQEQLQNKLSDPHTVDSLNRLLDRVDLISASVEMLDGFLRRSDQVADNISDSLDEFRGKQEDHAVVGLIDKLPTLARAGSKMADVAASPDFDRLLSSGLLERLAEPRTIQGMTALLDKLDLMVFAANAVDEFLRRGDEIADNAAESMNDLRGLTSSVDAEAVKRVLGKLPKLTKAGNQLLESGLLDKVSELTDAGMALSETGLFEPKTIKPLAELGRSAAESYVAAKSAPQKHYGIFDLLGLLKDPAIQKSLNIAVEMARQFGRKMA